MRRCARQPTARGLLELRPGETWEDWEGPRHVDGSRGDEKAPRARAGGEQRQGGGPLVAPDARHVDAERAGAAAVGADVFLDEGEPGGVPAQQGRRRLPPATR
jgi:hypothetical protein